MFKSIQIKVIVVFMFVGIIIIIALGLFFGNLLNNIQDINIEREILKEEVKMVVVFLVATFTLISILNALFLSKMLVKPIANLIKNTEKIASGEETSLTIYENPKNIKEINDLLKAFNLMTKELKENLNEVNRQKNQIETILLHMTDGIIAFNINGEIIHINPAAIRFLEISPKEKTFEDIFKKINVDINMEKIIYLENWTSSEQKINVLGKFINMFFAPFRDENDRPAGIMVVIQDITEHVKLDNMRKEFVADVSHELKTPLTSIMGYTEMLLEETYEKEMQDKFLGVIRSEAERMARLVSDLLTLSKYDNKEINWEKTEFDLGELVKKCQENLQIEINKKRHMVECYVTADVPKVYADKSEIERVVLNILSNSIKYTKNDGIIKIYVGFVYNNAYIKIIDNGIGIPEKDLSRIFERFYRVDKARTREMGGTGLRTFNCKGNT